MGNGGVDPCPGGVRKGRKLCPKCPWEIEEVGVCKGWDEGGWDNLSALGEVVGVEEGGVGAGEEVLGRDISLHSLLSLL